MDFIYATLLTAFWSAIVLMARGCDTLQGRRTGVATSAEGMSGAIATRKDLR